MLRLEGGLFMVLGSYRFGFLLENCALLIELLVFFKARLAVFVELASFLVAGEFIKMPLDVFLGKHALATLAEDTLLVLRASEVYEQTVAEEFQVA